MAYADEQQWGRPPRWRRWAARILALAALAACVLGIYAIVHAGTRDHASATGPINDQLTDVETTAGRLGDRLEALRSGSSPRRAIRAQRRAVDANRTATRALTASGPDGTDSRDYDRLANGLDAHRELLNAIGATLGDPSSRLRFQLVPRAARARRALAALPDPRGLPGTVRGIARLKAWARAQS